jgi:hypothetical protein
MKWWLMHALHAREIEIVIGGFLIKVDLEKHYCMCLFLSKKQPTRKI